MNTSKGYSLVEILVSVAALGVVVAGIAAFFAINSKQQMALAQKMEILAFKQTLLQAMANPKNCACLLNPANNTENQLPMTFRSVGSNSSFIGLTTLYGGCDASNKPTFPLAVTGQPLPGSQTGLRVASIQFNNIRPTGSGRIDEFQGQVEVTLGGATMPRAPVKIPQRVYIDPASPPAARTILTCSYSPAPSPPSGSCVAPAVVTANGMCYVLGAAGQNCNSACAALGLADEESWSRYSTGSDGTNQLCRDVLDTLGVPGSSVTNGTPGGSAGIGCGVWNGTSNRFRHMNPTNPAASTAGMRRACGCN